MLPVLNNLMNNRFELKSRDCKSVLFSLLLCIFFVFVCAFSVYFLNACFWRNTDASITSLHTRSPLTGVTKVGVTRDGN